MAAWCWLKYHGFMCWRPLIALAILVIVATTFVFGTSGQLPEAVATHFGTGNHADAWMTRVGYRWTMLFFLVAFPLLIAFLVGFLPRLFPRGTNIPNRDHWLAPERQAASMRFLFAHGCWLGCLNVLMIAGVHYTILEAHRSAPPILPLSLFLMMMGGFLLGVVVWIGVLFRRFRKPK